MRPRRIAAFSLALSFALAGSARAGGSAVAEQSAVAGGTAGAGTARAEDPGAAFYNPAALADGAGVRAGLGLLAALPAITARGPDGSWRADSARGLSTPPQLHLSYARGRFAGGLYAGVPFGGGASWPEGWEGRHEILESELQVFRVAPFAAAAFGRLRVAAGVHVDFGRLAIRRTLDFVDAEGDVRLDLTGTGLGAEVSAFWAARDDLDLGLSYKSRTVLELRGGADFEAPDAFAGRTEDQHAATEMTLPDRAALGVRWRRGELSLLADVTLHWWQVNEELVIDFENEMTPDAVQRNQWKTTASVRGGVELEPAPGWTLRGGALFDPSPVPARMLAPSAPDSTRLGVSAGFGRRLGPVAVDAFYEYLHLLARRSSGDESLAARYGGSAHLFGIGLRYLP